MGGEKMHQRRRRVVLALGFLVLGWSFLSVQPLAADECLNGDCQNGVGSGFTDEGQLYTGEWKDGVPHGKGKLRLTDGTVKAGLFEKGQFQKKGEAVGE